MADNGIFYDNNNSKFLVTVSGSEILTVSGSGQIFVSGTISASNAITASAGIKTQKIFFTDGSELSSSSTISSTAYIGAAEDGDYTDGLFTDLTVTTPVGTVVDRFNEILKALAPAPAPSLSNLEKTSGATGANMNLAFGTGVKEVSGYTAVSASLAGLSNVAFANTFSAINGSGASPIRMGVYASPIVLTMSLNNSVAANFATYTNYPAKAFNVSTNGVGSYILEINGVEITPTGSTNATSSANTETFVLAQANTASFTNSGQGLDIFRHRTGTAGIPTSLWRNGHNYAKVTHNSSLGTHTTNYIDWVYDPTGSSGIDNYSFTTPTSASFNPTGLKTLSGVKYYTGATYYFSSSISNYYKNTYLTNGLSLDSVSTGVTVSSITVPPPNLNTDTIEFSNLHTFNANTSRRLNQTLISRLVAQNSLGKTNNTTLTTNTILADNINTANTTLVENFCLEDYRVPSASYASQNDASSAIGTFPSGSALLSGELAVYNGGLRYPTTLLNNGNIEGSTVVHKLGDQPNYAGVVDNREYYRVFRNGASADAEFVITITGNNGLSVVKFNESLGANAVRIWIKVPGKTGWRDISTSAPASTLSPTDIRLNDNVGCLQGSVVVGSGTSQHTVNLLSEVLEGNPTPSYFLIRIEANKDFSNTISNITITGL